MECCSGRCTDDANGFLRCLPIGGCRPSGPVLTSQGPSNIYGEVCGANCDCCSNVCEADENGVKRCKKLGDPTCGPSGQVMLDNGEICETDCQCKSGLCSEPRPPDSGGQFPKRCLDVVAGADSCKSSGDTCVDPGQCCEGPCLPVSNACGFSCGAGGAPGTGGAGGMAGTGGTGGTGGLCVDLGGACTTATDCCTGYTCIPDGNAGLVCGAIVR
jgi:hypothetical protein